MLPSPTSNSPKPKVVRTSNLPRYSPLQGHKKNLERTATPPLSSNRSTPRNGSSRREGEKSSSQPRPPPPPSPEAQNRESGAAFHYRLKKQASTSFKQDHVTELIGTTGDEKEDTQKREQFRPWTSEYRSAYPNSERRNPPAPPVSASPAEDRGGRPKKSRFFAFPRASYKGDGRTFEGKLRDAVNTSKQVQHVKAYSGRMNREEYVPDSEAITPVNTPSTQRESTSPAVASGHRRTDSEASTSQLARNMKDIPSEIVSANEPASYVSPVSSPPKSTPSSTTPLQSNAAVVSSVVSTNATPTTSHASDMHPVPKPERPPQPNATTAVEELGTPKGIDNNDNSTPRESASKAIQKDHQPNSPAAINESSPVHNGQRQQVRPKENLTFNGQFPDDASQPTRRVAENSGHAPRGFEDHVSSLLSQESSTGHVVAKSGQVPRGFEDHVSSLLDQGNSIEGNTGPGVVGRSGVAKSTGDQIYDIMHYDYTRVNGSRKQDAAKASSEDSGEQSFNYYDQVEEAPKRFPAGGHYTKHLKVNTPEIRSPGEHLSDKERAQELGAYGRTYYELYPAPRPTGSTKPADTVRGWNRAVVDQTNPVHIHPRYPPDPSLLKPVETEYQRRCKEVWGKYKCRASGRK